jgi:ABC-type polysaccharide/polyol phosphate export permease
MDEARHLGRFFRDLAASIRLFPIWRFLAVNDLRVRFARSRLGFGWIFLSFAIWAGGVGLVYAQLFQLDATEFVPYLTVGFAIWGYLTASIVESGSAFIVAAGYVKQFNLPKQVYVWRAILSQAITLGLTLIICVVVLVILRPQVLATSYLALPGLLLLLFAGACHAFLFAYLTPYVRDLPHAAGSAMNVLFFLTPIIFPASLLRSRGLDILFSVNPFYYLIEGVRYPLLNAAPAAPSVYLGAVAYIAALALFSALVCGKLDRRIVYAL